ncbi:MULTISPECIES: type II toxin-antitoxin system RelB/DinJ family antitoxin [unclassified Moraxella]|uniref:type II toxin-antitoxin system RelB/DinJ family antitoxin n=1 Tax=unclassified Moraxella TaxID=2685852 RepID=UPI003AF9A636
MTAISYHIQIEEGLRDESFAVLDNYGLTPTQAFKLFLKQIANTKRVPLSFDYANPTGSSDYTLSPAGEARLRQSVQEMQNGEFTESSLAELLELKNA